MRIPENLRRPVFATLAAGLLIAALFAVPAEAEAAGDAPPVERLVLLFDDVAFGREVEERPGTEPRLIKWTVPVRIGTEQIGGDIALEDTAGAAVEHVVMQAAPVPEAIIETLRAHARALSTISGHDIRLAVAGEVPNLWVTLTTVPLMGRLEIPGVSRALLRRLAGPGRCYFVTFANTDGVIRRGHVVANRLLPAKALRHCLLEELTQSLGLPNDSQRLRPSVFSDSDTLETLSAADAMLLQVLYDPLMTPGMPREAALWRAEGLFRKLRDGAR